MTEALTGQRIRVRSPNAGSHLYYRLRHFRLLDCDVHFEISQTADKNPPRVIVETPVDSEFCKLLVPLSPLPHVAIRDADDLGQYLQRGENVAKVYSTLNGHNGRRGTYIETRGRPVEVFHNLAEVFQQHDVAF
jgi:hypothetical protein